MSSTHSPLQTLLNQTALKDVSTLSVQAARRIIEQCIVPITATEHVGIFDALDRIVAEDIRSTLNVPPHNNSAMDGFAFDGGQLTSVENLSLTVIGDAFAGHPFQGKIKSGECVRIMTGAVMPDGCDTVVPQELATALTSTSGASNIISFDTRKLRAGDNRRLAGEDLALNQIVIAKGKRLGAAELGLLASIGISHVAVFRQLRVAYFSTGDEIRSLGEPLDEGCIYDSNRYTIFAMLRKLGFEMIDLGVVPDHPEALENALRQACLRADAVITSGGVSIGAADYTKAVMAKLGEVAFWNIDMRPGRPMAFGKISHEARSAFLFGLPGNPVATMISFLYFVRNALLCLQNAQPQELLLVPARSQHAIRKRAGRTEYQRGIASLDQAGQLQVQVTGSQGSGILRSMSEANCMIVLADEQVDVVVDEMVKIHLFTGLHH